MSFSLWLGSPLPLFAQQSSASWARAGPTRLYVAAREQTETQPFELLRSRGVSVLDWTETPMPAEAHVLAAAAAGASSRHGGLPLLADAFRYACFARGAHGLAWADADSCCLPRGPGWDGLPAFFVASEPPRRPLLPHYPVAASPRREQHWLRQLACVG